jgi:hypothetical protein
MKFAFDLDGTLDKPALASLANVLLKAGHEVHIFSGVFLEAGEWQSAASKFAKLKRLGIETNFVENAKHYPVGTYGNYAILHCLNAVDPSFGRDYRLADLGLRKGALSDKLRIDVIFDDSEIYVKMIPAMNGRVTVLHVR